jgi:opacity protein-like surface antigen
MHRNTQPVHDISREVIMRISLRSGLLALATGTVLTSAMFLHVLPAHAADLITMRAPALAPATYNWSGAYVGANFGFAFDREDVTAPLGIFATDPSGVLGGVQLGYNYLFSSSWLLGIEGEFDWTSAAGNTNFNNVAAVGSVTSDHNWYGTLDGRLGYVTGPWMLYVKGGGAWMNADYRFAANSPFGGAATMSSSRPGWNVGTGVEYMLTPRWSAKLAYDYLDFGSNTLGFVTPFGTGLTFRTRVNEVKAGVNYHWTP